MVTYYLYLICLAVCILQGVLLLPILFAVGFIWIRSARRLTRLERSIRSDRRSESKYKLLDALPKLQPLNCESCGAGLLLSQTDTSCPNCDSRFPLPPKYAETTSIRTAVGKLFKTAMRFRRVASLLTYRPVRWFFVAMIFVEPLIFVGSLIGSNVFPDSVADSAFARMGETTSTIVIGLSLVGLFIWMFLFIFLAIMSKGLREKLPVVPVLSGEAEGSEIATCQTCGGAVEYTRRSFACICGYCNVVNFRAAFVDREHRDGFEAKIRTNEVLFGSLEIIEEYIATVFFVGTILAFAFVVLILYQACVGS